MTMGRYNSGELGAEDWACTDCSFNNFARRYICFECKKPRDGVKEEETADAGDKVEAAPVRGGADEGNHREGDWTCSSCQEHNFARRSRCFKCNAGKDGAPEEQNFEFRSGDWMCSACGTHNFARRAACFQCRKSRPEGGDWFCPGCSTNNFARRAYCFGCQQPKFQGEQDSNRYGPPRGGRGGGSYRGGEGPVFRDGREVGGYREDYNNRFENRRGGAGGGGGGGGDRARNGDWWCSSCNFHNFARRDTCKECGESKGDVETVQRKSNVQPGDWECPSDSCSENNFAWRTKCYKCETAKPEELEETAQEEE